MIFTETRIVTAVLAAILFAASTVTAPAQDQAAAIGSQPSITETFDAGDPSLMLGGQIDLDTDVAPWRVDITAGKLVMENRLNPQSLHYRDIAWVQYPDSDTLTSTEDAVISTVVEAENSGRGGAGILVGSGKAGTYLMLSVDGQGHYHVLRKDGSTLRPLRSARHVAIVAGAPNKLTFEQRGTNTVFIVNGAEIIKIPNAEGPGLPGRPRAGASGIGLAAFGIGEFSFDDVVITRVE